MEYREALITAYKENPCQVLPNAFWKTESQIQHLQLAYRIENGVISQLAAWDPHQLVVFWRRDRDQDPDLLIPVDDLSLALIHQDHYDGFPAHLFSRQKSYFRLIHQSQSRGKSTVVPKGFIFQEVKPEVEIADVAAFIDECYPDIKPTDDTVRSWMAHISYDPRLWFWVMDESKELPAGLGIAEIDQEIGEGSLEWVQVHPNYRGKGIGECLVIELISRLSGRVEFTTVSGEVGNKTNPEALYRRCGFQGSDIWWLLTRDGG